MNLAYLFGGLVCLQYNLPCVPKRKNQPARTEKVMQEVDYVVCIIIFYLILMLGSNNSFFSSSTVSMHFVR